MTLQEAQDIQKELAKHNPFVRLSPEMQKKSDKAYLVLSRPVPTTDEIEEAPF